MILNRNEYRNKVLGCWMGKNIGGTLGAPFEWKRQINDVSFYTEELNGEPLPNDDLDIQLLWLIVLEQRGVDIDANLLAEFWLIYVAAHWSEYGVAKANMRAGLLPPLSGLHNNPFKDSCGAFIRSELWACIAPGQPRLAARYALEDAIIDHGSGEGTFAAVFCAALESAAFIISDIRELIDIGLSYIPETCGVALATRKAIEFHDTNMSWVEARDEMLRQYRGLHRPNPDHISADDHAKGFADGKLGWDAPSNIGILVMGLLYGKGDFGRSMCIAVNCGEDTDCTAATIGSIFGILRGFDAIPTEWIKPIGRGIKTLCLNLGDLSVAGNVPQTVDELTARTERLAREMIRHRRLTVEISDKPTNLSDLTPDLLRAGPLARTLYANMGGPVFRFELFDVCVDYGGDPTIREGVPREIKLRVTNRFSIHRTEIYSLQTHLNIRWLAPESWTIQPGRLAQCFSWRVTSNPAVTTFTIQTDRLESQVTRLAIEITRDGHPGTMLVPVTLLNGNAYAQVQS